MTGDDVPKVRLRTEDPFATPAEERRADRRLRGRLVAPVTVWTTGAAGCRAGLTVSSVLVAEGDPPQLIGLVDQLSELRELLEEARAFVVHVLDESEQRLSGAFAGQYPGDPFEGLGVADSAHGPRLTGDRTVAACRSVGAEPCGFQDLVVGEIETIDFARRPVPPLARYRGAYPTLERP